MKSRSLKRAAVVLGMISLFMMGPPGGARGGREPKVSRPGAGLVFPVLVYSRLFPEDLIGVAMASETGQVVALTASKLYYLEGDSADPAWTLGAGLGWKHSQDPWISNNGQRVLFQTDIEKKKTNEERHLTMHFYDGAGKAIWEKPNPFRYQMAMLSPRGRYIVIGELMHKGAKVHDENLVLLWQKPLQYWYLTFDPLEHYIFDGEEGILYTIEGDRVWDFGAYTRVLSVSDDADFIMTQYFRTLVSSQRMFIMSRTALKKIELQGTGGCLSPDGLYTAYVSGQKKLRVYRTMELLEAGGRELPPLFETDFQKPWAIHISKDNRSLFIMGQESNLASVMLLVDLTTMKQAWKKAVGSGLRAALTTEDNRYALLKASERSIMKFRCY